MHFGKAVALGKQRENALRVVDEAPLTERLGVGGRRLFVAEYQHGQTLMCFVEHRNDGGTRSRERHALHVESRHARGIAREQPFDWRTVRADETFAGMSRIGETGLEQN